MLVLTSLVVVVIQLKVITKLAQILVVIQVEMLATLVETLMVLVALELLITQLGILVLLVAEEKVISTLAVVLMEILDLHMVALTNLVLMGAAAQAKQLEVIIKSIQQYLTTGMNRWKEITGMRMIQATLLKGHECNWKQFNLHPPHT
uniref:Uncharacterized protein MANES_06G084600 n=1 Tax=Rhizophora mucronata TaxID=61149 RepID=A0A2P2QTV1_RHIMU